MRHPEEVLDIFIESCLEQLGNIEKSLLDLEEDGENASSATVDAVFRAAHSIKGDANTVGVPQVATLAHEVENLLQAVREKRLAISKPLIDLSLHCFDRLRTMVLASKTETQEDISAELGMIAALLPPEAAAPPPASRPGTGPEPASPVFPGPADRPGQPPAHALDQGPEPGSRPGLSAQARVEEDNGRIRRMSVPAHLLDGLVDRIGELAIAHARLARIAEEQDNPRLKTVVEEIGSLSATLHGQALDMRMLPLKACFNKFRRLVRDVGQETGKKIELVIQGEDTEMDKTVIEQLSSPLAHLVRNAMAHGIEPPAERRSAGKDETGRVTLAARQVGNEVSVTVSDDGRGLDGEALAAKAVEKGLIEPGRVLTRQETLGLVFLPGLSTAKSLDMVSGRGVGMDAVLAAVTAMRGRVELESEPGRGSSVRLQFPLSLAIMDCLRAQVGDEDYFFHLDSVEECVEFEAVPDGGGLPGLISLREEAVPLVYLRSFFGLTGQGPRIAQVIITRWGESRFGVVVDRIVGRQQAVFKALGRVFGRTPGVQGATVLEDGGMAVIVDVPGLAKTALAEETRRLARPGRRHGPAKEK